MEPTKADIQEIVLDKSPLEASIAARPAIDQIVLRRRARSFLETVLPNASLPGAGLVIGAGPTNKVDSSDLLKRISETSERLLLAVDLIQAINQAGEPSPVRGTDLEQELFYPALQQFHLSENDSSRLALERVHS